MTYVLGCGTNRILFNKKQAFACPVDVLRVPALNGNVLSVQIISPATASFSHGMRGHRFASYRGGVKASYMVRVYPK